GIGLAPARLRPRHRRGAVVLRVDGRLGRAALDLRAGRPPIPRAPGRRRQRTSGTDVRRGSGDDAGRACVRRVRIATIGERTMKILVLAAIATAITVTAAAYAQSGQQSAWSPPRTSWGDPLIEGTYTNKDEYGTPLERPDEFAGKRLE